LNFSDVIGKTRINVLFPQALLKPTQQVLHVIIGKLRQILGFNRRAFKPARLSPIIPVVQASIICFHTANSTLANFSATALWMFNGTKKCFVGAVLSLRFQVVR